MHTHARARTCTASILWQRHFTQTEKTYCSFSCLLPPPHTHRYSLRRMMQSPDIPQCTRVRVIFEMLYYNSAHEEVTETDYTRRRTDTQHKRLLPPPSPPRHLHQPGRREVFGLRSHKDEDGEKINIGEHLLICRGRGATSNKRSTDNRSISLYLCCSEDGCLYEDPHPTLLRPCSGL